MVEILLSIGIISTLTSIVQCTSPCVLDINKYEYEFNSSRHRCLVDIKCDKYLNPKAILDTKAIREVQEDFNDTLTEIDTNLHVSCVPTDYRAIYILLNAAELNLTDLKFPLTWTHIQEVNVSHNNLIAVNNPSFGAVEHLMVLDLSYNKIEAVSKSAFVNVNGAPISIRMILLQHNSLKSLDGLQLSIEKNLQYLDVSNNNVESLFWIEEDYFNNLMTLKVDYNKLTSLGSHFRYMLHLQKVSLVGNSIKFIQNTAFSNLMTLKSLDLSSNNIETIQPSMFIGLHSLLNLNLSHNKIDGITEEYFRDSASLVDLDLSHNNLGQFALTEGRSFAPIDRLLLNDNNLTEEEIIDVLKLPLKVRQIHIGGNKFNCRHLVYRQAREMVHKNLKRHPTERDEEIEINCSTNERVEMFGVSPRDNVKILNTAAETSIFPDENIFTIFKELLVDENSILVEIRLHRHKEIKVSSVVSANFPPTKASHLSATTVAWVSTLVVLGVLAISIGYVMWKRYPHSLYAWRNLRAW